MLQIKIKQWNLVLTNIQKKRRGINIDKGDLMSAVASSGFGKMPKERLAKIINFLIHEGLMEVINNRVYLKFKSFEFNEEDGTFNYEMYEEEYYTFQTAKIRAFVEAQKEKEKEVK